MQLWKYSEYFQDFTYAMSISLSSLASRLWVLLNMHQYSWIYLNILKNAWINCSGPKYAWPSYMFNRPFKRPLFLNKPGFWIWHGSICKGYTEFRICLNMAPNASVMSEFSSICLNITEYAWIWLNIVTWSWKCLNMSQ